MEGGQSQLSRLRHDLYRTIRRVRGPYDRDLSPPWETVAAAHAMPKSTRSAWIIVAVAALLVAALWIAASLNLRARVETAAEQIDALAPKVPVVVAQPVIPDIPAPRKQHVPTEMERLSAFLADDIAAKRVEVVKSADKIVIRMLNASFPSGGVTLADSEAPLVARIAAALDKEKGPIVVIGHTDNVPVPAGSALGDNMTISRERARSAANVLRRYLSDPGRVSSEGRGANDPIASNTTAEGRSKNRRVEFWVDADKGQ
jgi:type VI secretion system protein ImpK